MLLKQTATLLLLLVLNMVQAQNLLPFNWKIAPAGQKASQVFVMPQDGWKDINLLLSWERQGYFGRDGEFVLHAKFDVPVKPDVKNWVLTVALQCNVEGIFINGGRINYGIPNYFWTQRGKTTSIVIPAKDLYAGKTNNITISVNQLSYTGGHSHNSCTLMPEGNVYQREFALQSASKNHIFETTKPSDLYIENTSGKSVVDITITNDFHKVIFKNKIELKQSGTFNIMPANLPSGFYECTAVLHNQNGYSGHVIQFGVSPEKITVSTDTISGYNIYWKTAKADLQKIAPKFRMYKVDSLCSPHRNAYVVEMQSMGNLTIRGYYFVPKKEGKYPAILHVPGYGYGFQNLEPFIESDDNVIDFALCVRGHGISADVFNPGFDIPGIWGYNLCNKQDNAYRAIYMDCVRSVDFLLSKNEVDPKRIGVEGGSQGGGLALATAGLCKGSISALAYFDPFPANIREHKQIRTLMDKELATYLKYYNNACSIDDVLHIQDLLDTTGFAHYIKCPVLFATALFDDDCPPHVGFTAYNRLKTDKQYIVYPNDSHLSESNYQTAFRAFFKEKLNF